MWISFLISFVAKLVFVLGYAKVRLKNLWVVRLGLSVISILQFLEKYGKMFAFSCLIFRSLRKVINIYSKPNRNVLILALTFFIEDAYDFQEKRQQYS